MAASDLDDHELRGLVHVAGPLETETVDSKLGYVFVQRCLRCDELLGVWQTKTPPSRTLRVGRLVVADVYDGIRGGRLEVETPGPRDRNCR